jgi:hypothetical protein
LFSSTNSSNTPVARMIERGTRTLTSGKCWRIVYESRNECKNR